MLRSRPGEIQETHAAGLEDDQPHPLTSDQQHICTSNFNNIFNPRLTCISSNIYSTAQLIMVSTSTAQLLASQDINRLFRLCVHPGPASSHISQPLVASFDKTATAPRAGGSDSAIFTSHFPRNYHTISNIYHGLLISTQTQLLQ